MKPKLLQILEKCNTIKQLKQTHLQIITNGFQEHNFLVPKLIHLSFDLISLDYAISVFQNSPNPNYIAYNTMIKCFIGNSHKIKEAVGIYKRMVEASVSPNTFTFCFLLRCFESVEALGCGRLVHGQIVKMGFDYSVFVGNTLLDFYAKCWGLEIGRKVFDEMPERDVVSWNIMIGVYMDCGEIGCAVGLFDVMPERSVVSWNTVISGASRGGEMELAMRVFKEMPERNEVSWNAMVSGYVKAGDLRAAEALFDEMPVKSVVSCTAMITGYTVDGNVELARMIFEQMSCRNEVSWNAMIAGYVHNNMFEEALSVFQQMLIEGKCKPDGATLVSALSACTHLGSLENGKWIDSYMKKNKVELSNQLGNALIDMFAKCGDLENASVIFNKMAEKCIITWTTMVTGLAVNGECRQAVEIFDMMCLEGLKPDDVLFIAVLTACAHGGLVDMGKRVFDQMINEYDIKPQMEHYGCMVDLLGRAGKLDEAVQFVEGMHLEPNAIIWTSLLSACKLHGKSELLKSISRKILKKEPSNPGYLTLITNSSSSVGQWQDALDIRMGMRSQGIEKVPGCSSIQIGNTVHEFLSKDRKHRHMKEIYQVLNSINGHVRTTCNVS